MTKPCLFRCFSARFRRIRQKAAVQVVFAAQDEGLIGKTLVRFASVHLDPARQIDGRIPHTGIVRQNPEPGTAQFACRLCAAGKCRNWKRADMADGVPETGKCFIQGDEVFFQGVFIRCGDRRDGMVHGLAAKRFFLAGVGERRGFLCNGASSSFPLLKSWMSLMKCSLK